MNHSDSRLASAFTAAALDVDTTPTTFSMPRGYREPKPWRKCSLPGCDREHQHNGGYCCAGHCREHRAILRTSNPCDQLGRSDSNNQNKEKAK